MRRCRTVIVIALPGSVPVLAAVLALLLVLPAGQSQAAARVQQAVHQTAPQALPQAAPVPVAEERTGPVMVLAAARFLPAGTLLADGHLTEVGIEEHLVGPGHFEIGGLGPDDVPYGYGVRKAIEAGTPLTRLSLVGPKHGQFLATVLKPGMRAVTVTLGAAKGISGLVDPGDRVDVVLTARSRESGRQSVLVRRFLENVRVVALDRQTGGAAGASPPRDEVERRKTVAATLEVLPSQTGLVALAALEGELSLALRPAAAAGAAGEAFDAADMAGPSAQPPESLRQQTVRVVRGRAVGDVAFGDELQTASPPEEVVPVRHVPEAGPEPEALQTLASARSGPGGDPARRAGGGAVPAGEVELGLEAQSVFFPSAEEPLRQDGQPGLPDVERQHPLAAASADPASVLVQQLAAGVGLTGAAGSLGAAEKPVELVAAPLPESAPAENVPDAGPDPETLPALAPVRHDLDRASEETVVRESVPAPAIGPVATPEFAPFPGEGTPAHSEQPAAFGVEPRDAFAAADVDRADPGLPAPGASLAGDAASAAAAIEAVGLSAVSQRGVGPAKSGVGALPALNPLGAPATNRRAAAPAAEQPAARGAPAAGAVEPTAAEKAAQAAVASLPWQLLSENRMVIVGGPILLLGLSGALLWLRRQDKALRARLQSVGAPLTGHGPAERVAPEESIFRPTRPKSRLSWLWHRIERRYPLIDAPRVFPRLVGVGVLAAALVWAGMWVLGMSGWLSLPAAAIAGFAGAWFFLRRVQARMEHQFIQQFPEIVDQIVRLSGAGLPPLEALGKVAEDAQQPVKGVLEEVSDALLAGLDADTALGMVAGRVRLAEFTLFAAVIRLQRRAGGSISQSFSNLAATLRERRTTGLKAKASTAQTRLTLLVLMLMPPVVLGVQSMTSPQSVDLLFNSEDGKTLLQLGVGLIVAGLVVARQIAARGAK
ncbi:MAG: Flp pilus assembly protein CpaB [Rhodospirillales bacterium]|nr:Flp pilus assembly protein CpaB [Rhodospirillales bacterium]